MTDRIRSSFLIAQERAALDLAASSDVFSLEPLGPRPHERYVLRFAGRSVLAGAGGPREGDADCAVGVWFPGDYLARAEGYQVLTWLGPVDIVHPNVRPPFICIGRIRPGTPLIELIYRLWSLIGYESYGLKEPLNGPAAAWARRNIDRFPIDVRPLKRRAPIFTTRVIEKGSAA